MPEILFSFKGTPVPDLLVLAGLIFIFAAIIGKFQFDIPPRRQVLAGFIGVLLFAGGLYLYITPNEVRANTQNSLDPTDPVATLVPPVSPTPSVLVFQVNASDDWRQTGIHINEGETVTVEVVTGQWTNWKGTIPYTRGEGTGYICGIAMKPEDCVEELPSAPSDALIGQVGAQMFLIGQKGSFVAPRSGILSLRINDGLTSLHDNDGSLTVNIYVNH